MFATAIIEKKRDSHELSDAEIRFMITGLLDGSVPDYQIAAWSMAVLCRGMTPRETAALTDTMLASGGVLNRASDRPRVDKHSTGGLGDKISLILAPLLACFDVDVPMLSGRRLGITGGTLDKLESFDGFRCDLSQAEIARQLLEIGCVITGTTLDIAPADRRLYTLRDVTGTVPSIPLITASIMSKKLAASLDALVLDVKCGSGAFMRTIDQARELANSLTATGTRCGLPTQAVVSNMDQPLGAMVGNACEVNESIDVLRGNGPNDVRELTLNLCSRLLVASGRFKQIDSASQSLAAALDDGSALSRFQKMVESQGARFVDILPLANSTVVESTRSGYIAAIACDKLGRAVVELGGGRSRQGDAINHRIGLEMFVRLGDRIEKGQPLLKIFAEPSEVLEKWRADIVDVFAISESRIVPPPLFH